MFVIEESCTRVTEMQMAVCLVCLSLVFVHHLLDEMRRSTAKLNVGRLMI
jgi:hypothetical protein